VLDVDKLGHIVLETEKVAVFNQFGDDLKREDGSLDRRALGQRVYGSPEKLAALEAIVHPGANRLTDEWIAAKGISRMPCVINAALLHKSSVFCKLDRIIIVYAPFFTRLIRAKQRDNLPWAEILRRFNTQKDFNSQYLSINAEIYKVENPGLFKICLNSRNQKLERKIDKIIEGI